ncbi:MAG: hypothetical protein P8N69_00935 [Flavobacteriales bacterium]|nr:hypothetical protein [Flavobacteriales bacterium]
MKITFLNFKLFLGSKVLERRLKIKNTRNVQSCNIEDAKSMGMLCVIKNENDYESTVQIIKLIKAEYKIPNIKILAFYPLKNDPEFLKSRLGLDFFTIYDLNYYSLPKKNVVKKFMSQRFDILLDLTENVTIPLRLVLLLSKSPFKIGSFSEDKKPYYDLMIETDPKDYLQYVKHVINYLKIFNKK